MNSKDKHNNIIHEPQPLLEGTFFILLNQENTNGILQVVYAYGRQESVFSCQ